MIRAHAIRMALRLARWAAVWQWEGLGRPEGAKRDLRTAWRDVQTIRAAGLFDGEWYAKQYLAGTRYLEIPLWHYVLWGREEGLNPHPLFAAAWYLQKNPDVAAAGLNPLAHYLRRGAAEGRDPHPLFAGSWYLKQNPDVAALGWNPLIHYLGRGGREGRDPHPLFETSYFLQKIWESRTP